MLEFDPETATLGGVSLSFIHLTIMSQFAKITSPYRKNKLSKWADWMLDLLNYPLAALELLVVIPPWPIYSYSAWSLYAGAILGTATAASAVAKKVRSQE